MLHTKSQGHFPFGSGEKGFLPYVGVAAILVIVTQIPRTNFRSPIPLRLHIKFGFDRPSGFGEDDGRIDHGYTISSPVSLKAQVS